MMHDVRVSQPDDKVNGNGGGAAGGGSGGGGGQAAAVAVAVSAAVAVAGAVSGRTLGLLLMLAVGGAVFDCAGASDIRDKFDTYTSYLHGRDQHLLPPACRFGNLL